MDHKDWHHYNLYARQTDRSEKEEEDKEGKGAFTVLPTPSLYHSYLLYTTYRSYKHSWSSLALG